MGLGLDQRVPQSCGAAEGALDVAAEVGLGVGLGLDRRALGRVSGRLALGALDEVGQEVEVVGLAGRLVSGDGEPGDAGAVGPYGVEADDECAVPLREVVERNVWE